MDILPLRRFVTADDEDGRSYAVLDDPTELAFQQGVRPVALTDLWRASTVPTAITDGENRADPFRLSPPDGGVQFRVVQFDPGANRNPVDGATVFAAMGAASEHAGDPEHPFMHRTRTVDFGLVLRGAITMVLEKDEYPLVTGDIVVQRGTNHEWRNDGDQPCLVAFILLDAE